MNQYKNPIHNLMPDLMPHSGIIWQAATRETMPTEDLEVLCADRHNEAMVGTLSWNEDGGFFECRGSNGWIEHVVKWAHITERGNEKSGAARQFHR